MKPIKDVVKKTGLRKEERSLSKLFHFTALDDDAREPIRDEMN
jgi:hypothetical protein